MDILQEKYKAAIRAMQEAEDKEAIMMFRDANNHSNRGIRIRSSLKQFIKDKIKGRIKKLWK